MKLGDKSIDEPQGHHLRCPEGRLQAPEHDDGKLLAGKEVLLEQEYYSVGGGFIEWKGIRPRRRTRRSMRSGR